MVSQEEIRKENIRVKRAIHVYLGYIVLVIFDYQSTFFSLAERSHLFYLARVLVFIAIFVILIRLIFLSDYMIVRDGKIKVVRDLFIVDVYTLKKITRVEYGSSPFSKSYIFFEDYSSIEFNYFYVNDVDFKNMLKYIETKYSKDENTA
jgi:hypothetical protein